MREVNLRGIDLNLLVVLEALIEQRSVTRAAALANMSQPAMSRALGRLRALLGDPILARGAAGLVPTPKALALHPKLKNVLADIRGLVADAPFDPGALAGSFAMAATDHQTIMLLPRVMARLSRQAPGLDVTVVPLVAGAIPKLQDGAIDLGFGIAEAAPPRLLLEPLYRDRFVTLMRSGHPAEGAWSLERFVALEHVLVTVMGDGRGAVDDALLRIGRTRRIALRLPHFYAAISVVARTDLVVTLPASLADQYSESFGLTAREPPIALPQFTTVTLWSEVLDREPGHRWIRNLVREAAAEVEGVLPLA